MTTLRRSETRSISIQASPDAVLDLVADPQNLPGWAPGFASDIRPDGDDWIINAGDEEARIRVRVSREHGTVDFLSVDIPGRGGYSRVLPNEDGSEYQFTLLFPDGTDDAMVKRQMAVVQDELQAIRSICEGR